MLKKTAFYVRLNVCPVVRNIDQQELYVKWHNEHNWQNIKINIELVKLEVYVNMRMQELVLLKTLPL